MPRIYVGQKLREGNFELPQAAAHHVSRVLRLREGDPLVVFDGSGGEWSATVKANGNVLVGKWRNVERESPLRVTLVQGVSSGDRMDSTVQKAVELGVAAIQPVLTEKSVVRLKGELASSRLEHWRRIVIASCEQCGRNRLPEVRPVLSLDEYCNGLADGAARLLLAPTGTKNLRDVQHGAAVTLAAGPEAGFSETEEAALERAGFTRVRLGPRVLRTETAALAALAALSVLAGDF